MRYRIEREPLSVTVGDMRFLVQVTDTRVEALHGGTVRAYLRRVDLIDMDVDVVWTTGGIHRVSRESDRDALDDALRAIGRQVEALHTIELDAGHVYHLGHVGQYIVAWDGEVAVARQRRGRDVEWMPPPADVPEAARGILADRLAELVTA